MRRTPEPKNTPILAIPTDESGRPLLSPVSWNPRRRGRSGPSARPVPHRPAAAAGVGGPPGPADALGAALGGEPTGREGRPDPGECARCSGALGRGGAGRGVAARRPASGPVFGWGAGDCPGGPRRFHPAPTPRSRLTPDTPAGFRPVCSVPTKPTPQLSITYKAKPSKSRSAPPSPPASPSPSAPTRSSPRKPPPGSSPSWSASASPRKMPSAPPPPSPPAPSASKTKSAASPPATPSTSSPSPTTRWRTSARGNKSSS